MDREVVVAVMSFEVGRAGVNSGQWMSSSGRVKEKAERSSSIWS